MLRKDGLRSLQLMQGIIKFVSRTLVQLPLFSSSIFIKMIQTLSLLLPSSGVSDWQVDLDFRAGVDAQDWTELAKKDHLKPLDVSPGPHK